MNSRRRPPYYVRRPGEPLWWYIRRVQISVRTMLPYVRVYGVRYLFDTTMRERVRRQRKQRWDRKKYGAGFLRNKKSIKLTLIRRHGSKCQSCQLWFDHADLTIDHINPVYKGGTSDYANLQLLCLPCHDRKSKEDFPEKHVVLIREHKDLFVKR